MPATEILFVCVCKMTSESFALRVINSKAQSVYTVTSLVKTTSTSVTNTAVVIVVDLIVVRTALPHPQDKTHTQ
eukprot:jgi/Chrzof1/9884/Cz04g19180.t1